jgi:hypothetical protein
LGQARQDGLSEKAHSKASKEMLELHKLAIEEARKMTPEQGFKDLVASGIYTPDGKLAKECGG